MRVALLQHNAVIGDIAHNLAKITDCVVKKHREIDLFVSSELALTGYPPRDLISFPALYKLEEQALDKLKLLSKQYSVGILLGHHIRLSKENRFYNSASLFENGHCLGTVKKQKLPDYNIFEENRHYVSGSENPPFILFRGHKLGLSICEDLWDSTFAFGENDSRSYPKELNPLYQQSEADYLINLSASPFRIAKDSRRLETLKSLALKTKKHLIYVNSIGAQDELIFEGASKVISPKGQLLLNAPSWKESAESIDLSKATPLSRQTPKSSTWLELQEALVLGIRDYLKKTTFSRVVLGLSGGVDSALIASLATQALGAENVFAYSLPSVFTHSDSKDLAYQLAENLGISLKEIPIQDFIELAENKLRLEAGKLPHENFQSRIRGNILMAEAQKKKALLLATGNKCEYALGYATLYGDIAGALAPIGDLYKTEVYGLCHYINSTTQTNSKKPLIPSQILTRAPTAELRSEQKDSDSLPPYEILDVVLKKYIENKASQMNFDFVLPKPFSSATLFKSFLTQEFKRFQAPPILRVHQRAFGAHWKMPLAQNFSPKQTLK